MRTWLLFSLALLGACTSQPPPEAGRLSRNTLGMEFVRVPGLQPWVCRHETRVRDYARFVRETGREWPEAGFTQTPEHPAVNVSWQDAQAFCQWLGRKEQRHYRLPTDAEWSFLAGLQEQKTATRMAPKHRPQRPGWHPWGRRQLQPGDGNFCDLAFGRSEFGQDYQAEWLKHYDDGHAATAPVKTYPADARGLHDLAGNVWEWCEDWYDPPQNTLKVLRGASWRTGNPERLWSSYRGPDPINCRIDSVGFRVLREP